MMHISPTSNDGKSCLKAVDTESNYGRSNHIDDDADDDEVASQTGHHK